MLYAIQKSNNNKWSLIPTDGALQGKVVAEAEGVTMKDVKVSGQTLLGTIKALWGAEILNQEVYDHHEALRGLGIGGKFDMTPPECLHFDFDGLLDATNKPVHTVATLMVLGTSIYGRKAR